MQIVETNERSIQTTAPYADHVAASKPGSLDPTFNIGVESVQIGQSSKNQAVVIQPDQKLISVGSSFSGAQNGWDFALVRYTSDFRLDATFGNGGAVTVDFVDGSNDFGTSIALQNDGKILAAGYSSGSRTDFAVTRVNNDGSPDLTFGLDGKVVTSVGQFADFAYGLSVQPDGKIVVVGGSVSGSFTEMAVARYHPDGSLDSSFGQSGVARASVGLQSSDARAIVLQSDEKIVVTGSSYNGLNQDFAVVRFTADGLLDGTFGIGGKVSVTFTPQSNDFASAIALTASGKIVIAGSSDQNPLFFASVMLSTNGSLDSSYGGDGKVVTSFGFSGSGATSVSIQPDGKVVLAGFSYSINSNFGLSRAVVVRYDPTGVLDATFSNDGKATGYTSPTPGPFGSVIQPDASIVLAGAAGISTNSFGFARFKPDGRLDDSFGMGRLEMRYNGTGNDSKTFANAVLVQADGRIVVVGADSRNSSPLDRFHFAIARYLPDGSIDEGITKTVVLNGSSVDEFASSVLQQPDGKIVVVGTTGTTSSRFVGVLRFNNDGTPDNSFDGDGKAFAIYGPLAISTGTASILQPDGKLVVVGSAGTIGSLAFGALRLNSDGSLDTTFGDGGRTVISFGTAADVPYAVTRLPSGKIVLVGSSGSSNAERFALACLNVDGTLDSQFGNQGLVRTQIGVSSIARASAIQSDGKIVVVGETVTDTEPDFVVARYSQTGSLDSEFGEYGVRRIEVGTNRDSANAVLIQPDGKIVIGGSANNDENSDIALVRLDSVGGTDQTFGLDGKVLTTFRTSSSETVNALAIQSDGRIVAAGASDDFLAVARYIGDSRVFVRQPSFDLDGDGKTDISVFRPVGGSGSEWWYLRSSDGGNRAFAFGEATDTVVPADFTGDGKTDLAFWRPASGEWFVLRSEDSTFFAFPFGAAGDVPSPADFDGDGKSDATVYRPSTNTWFTLRSSDGQVAATPFGTAGDKPVPADYDGDGKADVAIFRPTGGSGGGEWWYLRSSDGANRAFAFGTATDLTVPGDYTGDGKADLAYFRPSTGEWYVLRSEDSSFYAFPWGANGDLPAPGDYDGDGKIDAAVFRPSNSNWFALRSTAGPLILQFGTTGDRPLPNAFVR